jgi:hypothetical protein
MSFVPTCTKKKYDKIGAMMALSSLMVRDKGEKRIYFCKQCDAYHLTSKTKEEYQNAVKKRGIRFYDRKESLNE